MPQRKKLDLKDSQCSAMRSRLGPNGEQVRCKRLAIKGGNVCQTHGGGAPQVKAAARDRIAALVDPAIGVLSKLVRVQTKKLSMLHLSAAKDVLDRAGYKPKDEIVVSGNLAERLIAARKRVDPVLSVDTGTFDD